MMSNRLPIDIVIPIHNAFDDLVECIGSVLACTREEEFRLVLVDDASTDTRVSPYLAALVQANLASVTLLRNPTNLGFSNTVNLGMQVSQERDLVLLNSDTRVTAGWVRKLRRCADADERIGTITPFSNNATICSFPRFGEETDLSTLPPIDIVNRSIEECASPSYPDIPSAIGFCMFIRRTVLRKVGLFDANTFGLGYGEDNDFSMRVARAGYRNVLCDDTFIAHTGSRSFDKKKHALSRANLERLAQLHPGYADRVRSFIRENPLVPMLAVAAERMKVLATGDSPGILHVLHGDPGGGTREHVMDLMRVSSDTLRQYVLFASGTVWSLQSAMRYGVSSTYRFSRGANETWADVLADVCGFLSIDLIHVHHISGARVSLLEALASLQIPYGVTLHDFYLVCPTVSLLALDGAYCGAPLDPAVCRRCLGSQIRHRSISIEAWRSASAQLLSDAAFVIAPSRFVASIYQRYFPQTVVRCIAHGYDACSGQNPIGTPSAASALADGRRVIGVLGAISPAKGARHFERLVERSSERQLPVRWVLIGYTDRVGQDRGWSRPDRSVTIHGAYDRKQIAELADRYAIELFVFPSAGPESFSYTLSEAWAAGRPVLVPPFGALGERVSTSGAGWIMEDWRNADAILDQLMDILGSARRDDFERIRSIATAVPGRSVGEMGSAVISAYRQTLLTAADGERRSPSSERALARMRVAAELGQRPAMAAVPPAPQKIQLPGRNDNCPCGSGKRYKQCCGRLARTSTGSASTETIAVEGLRRQLSGKPFEARELFERALELDAKNGLARHYLGMSFWQSGNSEMAEPLVRESLEQLPARPEFYNNHGLCLSSLWQYEAAISAYRRALDIDPEYAPAHNNLGLSMQHVGELQHAVSCFRRALELSPDFAEARWNLDVALRNLESP